MSKNARARNSKPGADDENIGVEIPMQDLELVQLKERFDDCARISIRKLDPQTKQWVRYGNEPADIVDEDYLATTYGGGQFQLFFRRSDGTALGSCSTIFIADPKSRREEKPGPTMPTLPVLDTRSAEIELLKAQLERRDSLMLEMIHAIKGGAVQQPQPATNILDLVTALNQLQQLQGKTVAPAATFSERLMERALEVAAGGKAAAGEDENPGLSFAREVFREMKPILFGKLAPAAGAPAAAAGGEPAGESVEDGPVDLTDVVSYLKEHCRQQHDAEKIAKLIGDTIDVEGEFMGVTPDVLQLVLQQPYSMLTTADPELAMPGFAVWFNKLFEVLRVRFMGSAGNPGGPGGDTANS